MVKSFNGTGKIDISSYGIKVDGNDIAEQIAKAIGPEKEGSTYCAPLYGKITVIIDAVDPAPFGEKVSNDAIAHGYRIE